MGLFDDINDEPVQEFSAQQGKSDERFHLISRLISTPDTLSEGDRIFHKLEKLIRTDFLNLTTNVGILGESAIYAELMTLLEDLHELIEFPYLANKNILAVGGEFSAGKSCFLNAVFGVDNLLPTGVNPTTAIPTYLTHGEREEILALNTFNRSQVLSREDLNAISHGFNANQGNAESRISFYHVLRLLQVQSPNMKWEHIAFLDTPGYSKPKENVDNEEDAIGTDAGNTDEEKAREHLSNADYLIWVVGAKDGTFQGPGIAFLRDKVKWVGKDKPLYLLVNKIDQQPKDAQRAVYNQICKDARNAGFNVKGTSAYSSRERKVYMGDNPIQWFAEINEKIKLTKWRGRFKAITEKVIRYCEELKTRLADYEKILGRVQCEPDIDNKLLEKVKKLCDGISRERENRKSAIEQFAKFSDKAEKYLEELLQIIGVDDETAADVGLVAVSIGDENMMRHKKGDRFTGIIERYSKFNGCYLRIPDHSGQIQIRREMVEKVTNPVKTLAVGRKLELEVYEINFAQKQVTFTVKL